MPGTHHQLLYHFVFSTKNRKPLLQPETRETMFKYIGGVARGLDAIPIRIGGWIDHVHLLMKLRTTHCISDFMRELKANTSKNFNDASGKLAKFGWQDGYGAFTVSPLSKDKVIHYIENQVRHHADETYKEEYVRLLQSAGIDYDDRYLWA